MIQRLAAGLLLLSLALISPARAQQYNTMTDTPQPNDFVSRADAKLTLLGNPIRFSGADLPWLGVRPSAGAGSVLRAPTLFEVHDILETVQALGGSIVRARSLAGSVGCALCIEPKIGQFNAEAFAQLDMVLVQARDMGLKFILPLVGPAGDCTAAPEADPFDGGVCTYVRAHGGSSAGAFFTDARMQADFRAHVVGVLEHVNAISGVAYADDPTILAWENCDACAANADPAAAGAWVEQVGRIVHEHDRHHLYENGAFAGRIGTYTKAPVQAGVLTTPSVDIVGDQVLPARSGVRPTPRQAAEAAAPVTGGQRVYVIDEFGCSPADWPTLDDLSAFLNALTRRLDLTGALVAGLQGHADQGGFLPGLPPEAGQAAEPALYFPGAGASAADRDMVEARVRVVRHLGYDMADIRPTPNFPQPDPPEVLSVVHGRIAWRGSAGARSYSVERSADPLTVGSWQLLCDRCVTDGQGFWQDPAVPKGRVWYRVSPTNPNDHVASPSAIVEGK